MLISSVCPEPAALRSQLTASGAGTATNSPATINPCWESASSSAACSTVSNVVLSVKGMGPVGSAIVLRPRGFDCAVFSSFSESGRLTVICSTYALAGSRQLGCRVMDKGKVQDSFIFILCLTYTLIVGTNKRSPALFAHYSQLPCFILGAYFAYRLR